MHRKFLVRTQPLLKNGLWMVFYIFGGRSIVVVVQLVFVAKLSKQILTKAREPSLLYTFYMLGN